MQNFDKKRSRLFAFPARTIMISFVLVILVGSVLLMLPFSSKSREFTGFFGCVVHRHQRHLCYWLDCV